MLDCYYYIIFIVFLRIIDLSKGYKNLTLEDSTLCSPIVKRRIKLGTESNSALLVSINSLKDHSLEWNQNFFCKFQIDVPKNKIFMVIQNLSFRRNMDTNECIDYLHLKRADGSISNKFCGHVSAYVDMNSDQDMVQPNNTFDDFTGQLDVNIHIDKKALRVGENTEFVVVFTSYRPCGLYVDNDQECRDDYPRYCIFKGFLNDSFINCPYIGCVDEGGCNVKVISNDNRKREGNGNKVIISAVTVLFIAFVVFICFIWLCRKYQKLCWAEQFSNSNRSPRPGAVIELNPPPSAPEHNRESTTAMSTTVPEEDKDLPPSYESLFPNG